MVSARSAPALLEHLDAAKAAEWRTAGVRLAHLLDEAARGTLKIEG